MAAQARQIAPGVAWLECSRIANVYLLGERDAWILVDTAMSGNAKAIRAAAEARFGAGAKPLAIVLTHGHLDHSGSAAELSRLWGVPVLAHPAERRFLGGKELYPAPDPGVGGFMALLSRVFPRRPIDLAGSDEALPPDGSLPGLREWGWIHTPGHAPGHVSLYRYSDGTLIAGDAFTTVNLDSFLDTLRKRQRVSRPPAPFTCDWETAHESVRTLSALAPHTLACGHGIPLSGPDAARQLRHLANHFPTPANGRYTLHPARS